MSLTLPPPGPPSPGLLPLPPQASWPLRRKVDALRRFHLGGEWARDEVGPVACVALGPQRLGARLAPRFVFVGSAQGAHDVLAVKDSSLDKHGALHEELRRHGRNIFDLAHDDWVPRRRAIQPVFTRQRTATYAEAMGEVVAETGPVWAASGRVDLQAATRTLTTEVLGRSLLGMPLGDRAAQIAQDFQVYAEYSMARALRPVRAPLWLPTPPRAEFRASMGRLVGLAAEAVARVRDNPILPAPLIRQLLAAVDPETGLGIAEDDLLQDLVTFILAGHDTTATTLAYALWQLGRHPEIQDAVAEEAAAVGPGSLEPTDVVRLPVTVRVLHEALRLCPPAGGVSRQARRDVAVDGHLVPAGWNVVVSVYALHRDPAAWDRPEVFDPDRFLPERSSPRNRWQYLPFGGGQRKCIGDHFAMLEASIALATLVRDLRFESLGGFDLAAGFTMQAASPVPARITARG
jgi:cytochrome P450